MGCRAVFFVVSAGRGDEIRVYTSSNVHASVSTPTTSASGAACSTNARARSRIWSAVRISPLTMEMPILAERHESFAPTSAAETECLFLSLDTTECTTLRLSFNDDEAWMCKLTCAAAMCIVTVSLFERTN